MAEAECYGLQLCRCEDKEETKMQQTRDKRIFIAVGHGGKDPGAVSPDGLIVEAQCNWIVAKAMQGDLQRHGLQVKLSRGEDEDDPLKKQIAECNAYDPDLAVAVHTNAGGGSGFEVFYQSKSGWSNLKSSEKLAKKFHNEVQQFFPGGSRGVKTRTDLGWLNQVTAPAILCENFFVDGPKASWYANPERLHVLGKVYARAVLKFYDITYNPDMPQTVRYSVFEKDRISRDYTAPGFLVDGHWYLQIKTMGKNHGLSVSWDKTANHINFYDSQYYTEQPSANGLLCIDNFSSREEALLAGVSAEALAAIWQE